MMNQLEDLVGEEGILLSEEQRGSYRYDLANGDFYVPDAVVFPKDIRSVSAIMALAGKTGTTVLPQGAGTRRTLFRRPDRALVLSTAGMGRILDLDRGSLTLTLESGVPLRRVQRALEEEGLFFPPYPYAFETSTMGGCAANGTGGPSSARYGVFKQFVLGMGVVTPNGERMEIGGQTLKNVVGYDLTALFCGSQGSLGLITTLTLRLLPTPPVQALLIMSFETEVQACGAMEKIAALKGVPARLSMLDPWMTRRMESLSEASMALGRGATVLCHVEGLGEAVKQGIADLPGVMIQHKGRDLCVVEDRDQISALWRTHGLCLSSLQDDFPAILSSDIIVPRRRAMAMMEKCLESAKRHYLTMTHAGFHGTGVFHPVILRSEDLHDRERARRALSEMARYALSVGGNVAGPFNSVGPEMAHFYQTTGETAPQLVAGMKDALDPKGIMKPLPFDPVEGLPPFTGI